MEIDGITAIVYPMRLAETASLELTRLCWLLQGLSADDGAQKQVLHAIVQLDVGYKYFLKLAVVTVTALPSKIAAGNNSRLGYTAVGQDRYSMQGIYTAGLTIRLAWW